MSEEQEEQPKGVPFRMLVDGGLILAVAFTAGGWVSSARTMQAEIDALKASPVSEARVVRIEEQVGALRDEFRAYRAEAREDAQAVIRELRELQSARRPARAQD